MSSLTLLGAVGGAGTTRTCLEFGSMLARDGRSVAVLDAAYATQGLSDHVPGRITCDMTALVLDDAPLETGLIDIDRSLPGRLACCPAHAPFERLARAKTPAAARRFEELIGEAMGTFDHVLVDTPPVAANQAVAAVTGAGRVAIVTPAGQRGTDGLARAQDRLADIGVPGVTIRTNTTEDATDANADATLPAPDVVDPTEIPTSANRNSQFTAAVAESVETVLGVELDVEINTGFFSSE